MKHTIHVTTVGGLLTTYKVEYNGKATWDRKKREELIQSLQDGYLVGAFTLQEKVDKYTILDGRERYLTLRDFLTKPSGVVKYEKYKKLVQADLEEVLGSIADSAGVYAAIEQWYNSIDMLNSYKLALPLYNIMIARKVQVDGLENLVGKLHECLIKPMAKCNIEIGLMIYRGSDDKASKLRELSNK